MTKQLLAFALCLSVLLTNNAYSMNQDLEGEQLAIRVAPRFQLSDVCPWNWSLQTKCAVAKVGIFSTIVSLGAWHFFYTTDNEDDASHCYMKAQINNCSEVCNSSLTYTINCDEHACNLVKSSSGPDQIYFIFKDVICEKTRAICTYVAETPYCDFIADYYYNKTSLKNGFEFWEFLGVRSERIRTNPQSFIDHIQGHQYWSLCRHPNWRI